MTKAMYIGVDGTARKVNKMYVGVANKPTVTLPSGYAQVEYIESSGTQYIKTGLFPTQNYGVEVVFQTSASADNGGIVGCDTDWQSNGFAVYNIALEYGDNNVITTLTMNDGNKHTLFLDRGVAYLDGKQVWSASGTFTTDYEMYICATNRGGTLNQPLIGKIFSCKVYDGGVLIRDLVPCRNSSGSIGMYDIVNNVFYANSGSGTFTTGIVYDGVGIARKVKKAYIGVNGIARLFFGSMELKYKGVVSPLSRALSNIGATTVGDYALFAGGYNNGVYSKVDAYNSSLVKSSATSLPQSRQLLSATTVGNYALFAGGSSYIESQTYDSVAVYDNNLTYSSATNLSTARTKLAGASVGNYALFAGGATSSTAVSSSVDTYNASLTKGTATSLSTGRREMASTTVGDYALFAGGASASTGTYNTVDTYSTSLTKGTTSILSGCKIWFAATTVGNYAIFAGGFDYGSNQGVRSTVDVYDGSLTKVGINLSLSVARSDLTATTLGNYAMFAGGYGEGNDNATGEGMFATVDVFDESLTMSTITGLSQKREKLASATIGNYALFAGGDNGDGTYYDTVDVYELA